MMFQLAGFILFVTTALVSTYAGPMAPIQLTDPSLASIDSPTSTQVIAGKQLFVKTTAYRTYNDTEPLQFIAIIYTRNSEGVTLSIAFQSASLEASQQAAIGTSWTPPEPGIYYLRAFTLSELENPIILSSTVQSTVTVV